MVTIKNTKIAKTVGFLCALGVTSSPVMAEDNWGINVSGYARAFVGMNLEDHDETPADDQFELNMVRGAVYFDIDAYTGPLNWKVVTRFDKEVQTDYLRDLELNTNAIGGNTFIGSSQRGDYLDQFETDHLQELFREYYVDFTPVDGVDLRIGKQQLVWGESDFFQAMDLVHGFDFRWRLFFENNEDWRKPLFLINANIDIPKFDGSLNVFVRPGLDREEDIGNNFNIEGGRWIPHPYRGVDFTAFTDYNADDNDEGDKDDPTYGVRWNSGFGSIGYSIAYLKTFNPAPIMNPAVNSAVPGAFGVTSMRQHGNLAQNQVLGDWTFPLINVFGFSVNGYSAAIDSTLSAEVTFVPDKPYNFGELGSSLPGWGGVIEKNTVVAMFRLDKELKLTKWLGTNRPSLSSIQLFDTWILDHQDSDEIVEFASFGARKREHTAYLTLFTLLNFKRDTINPSFVVGTDLSNGGGFAIPAVEFVFGDDWRIKAEANLWWTDGDEKKNAPGTNGFGNTCNVCANPLGVAENGASLFDWFADDNQVVLKITRQF